MILELILAATIAAAASGVLCLLMFMAGLWDNPDVARKAHRAPTPTSGGLATGAGFALALVVLCVGPWRMWADGLEPGGAVRLLLATLAAFLALALGFYDDLKPLGAKFKFGLGAFLSLLVAVFVGRAEVLPLAPGAVLHLGFIAGGMGSALWVFTLVNATNFMDGANGLAMGSSAIGLVALAIVALLGGAPHAALLAMAGAGALVGFLIWNAPGGKIFAGDSGSLFAGMLGAAAALIAIQDGAVSPFLPPILFLPLLADVLLTLLWRLRRNRRLLDAHADHVFQFGLRAGLSHARVARLYWLASLVCGAVGISAAWTSNIAAAQPPETEFSFAALLIWLAAAAPALSLAALAFLSTRIARRVRGGKAEPAPATSAAAQPQ